jgi:hypothetical protein
MGALIVFGMIAIQVILALVSPVFLVDLSLLTGVWPMSFGPDDMLNTAFGRFDVSSLRLLGLWLAITLVILLRFGQGWDYTIRYRWHLFFLLFCVLSLSWAPSLAYGVRMLAKLSAPFLFLVFVQIVITTRAQLKRMEGLMLIAGVSMLVLAVLSKLVGWEQNPVGLTIPATAPSLFSAFLITIAMLTISRMKYDGVTANLALFLLLAAGVLAAFTRITIAALFVSASVVLFYVGRSVQRFILPMAGLIGLPTLFLFSETFKNRMFFGAGNIGAETLLTDPGQAMSHLHGSGRFGAWSIVLTKFFDPSPVIGSGVGTTQNFFYSQNTHGLGVIHSEYVRLLAEVGVVGLTLFVVAAGAYFLRLMDTYRRAPTSDAGKYAAAAIGSLVAYLIFMATDNGIDYVNGFGIYVFTLVAMSEKARELETADARRSPEPGPVEHLETQWTSAKPQMTPATASFFPYHTRIEGRTEGRI